jgi:HAD superfamily hydrolase (TIGR01509 family)
MPLRAVAFDMDGLMFNSEDVYTEVGVELMRRRGRDFPKGLKDAMMGLPPQPSFEAMIRWHALDDTWEELARESEDIFLLILDRYLAPMPGLPELLDALESAAIPKAVVTSSGWRLTDAVLSRFDLARRFAFVLTSEDITHGKPDPEVYLLAARRLGVAPAEMMVLEDSHFGTRAGAAAGAFVVAIPNEHTAEHDFSPATLVADSLADPRIYEALGFRGKTA